MVHNFLVVAEHVWKSPEMEFSDRVDMVLKKSHKKIFIFRKVTGFDICAFFFCQKSQMGLLHLARPFIYEGGDLRMGRKLAV